MLEELMARGVQLSAPYFVCHGLRNLNLKTVHQNTVVSGSQFLRVYTVRQPLYSNKPAANAVVFSLRTGKYRIYLYLLISLI